MQVVLHPAVNRVHPIDIDGVSGLVEASELAIDVLQVYVKRYNAFLGQANNKDHLAGVRDVLRRYPRLLDSYNRNT